MNSLRLRCAWALVALLAGFGAPQAWADDDAGVPPPTGTCALLGALTAPFAYMYGQDAGPGWGLTLLATFNFDTRTFEGNVILINPAAHQTTQQPITFSAPFTIAPGPIPGSYLLTSTVNGTQGPFTFRMNALPVNRGNTLLIQQGPGVVGAADGGLAATCQF